MRATFDGTVAILVKAYLNDTLIHGKCHACAVGNIISANGYVFGDNEMNAWNWLQYILSKKGCITPHDKQKAEEQIEYSGYTWQQLGEIEKAFEAEDPDMFNGLMAVVDVLAEIHNVDLTETESAKALFVKA